MIELVQAKQTPRELAQEIESGYGQEAVRTASEPG